MSTPLEFDEKKFWITLFSIMAKREAANANAITARLCLSFPRMASGTLPNGFQKRTNPGQHHLSVNYKAITHAL
jgi:hypothetical protein